VYRTGAEVGAAEAMILQIARWTYTGLRKGSAAAPRSNLKFFIEAGTFENDVGGSGGQILEESRHLRNLLRALDMK